MLPKLLMSETCYVKVTSFASPTSSQGSSLMAEFAGNAGSGLLDLSATSLADLPQLDNELLEITLDRLMQPCGDGTSAFLPLPDALEYGRTTEPCERGRLRGGLPSAGVAI